MGTSDMRHSPFLKCLPALYCHTLDLVLSRKSESPKCASQSQQTSKYKSELQPQWVFGVLV